MLMGLLAAPAVELSNNVSNRPINIITTKGTWLGLYQAGCLGMLVIDHEGPYDSSWQKRIREPQCVSLSLTRQRRMMTGKRWWQRSRHVPKRSWHLSLEPSLPQGPSQ